MPTASWRSAAAALVRRLEAMAEPNPEALAEIRQVYLAFEEEAAQAAEAGRTARLAAAREDLSARLAAVDWDRLPEGIGMKAAGLRELTSAADVRSILAIGSRMETLFKAAAKALAAPADTARLWKTYQAAAQAAVGDPALLEQAQEAASAFEAGRHAEAALADELEAALDGATRLLRENGETRAPAAADRDVSAPGAPALVPVDDRDGRADGTDDPCAADVGQKNDGADDTSASKTAAPKAMTERSASVPAGEEEKKLCPDAEAPDAGLPASETDERAPSGISPERTATPLTDHEPDAADAANAAEALPASDARSVGLPAREIVLGLADDAAHEPANDPAAPDIGEVAGFAAIEADPPARWGGARSVEDLVARYLEAGETTFAWRLAELAGEHGLNPQLPPAILKALAASPSVSSPYDVAAQRVGEMLAAAQAEIAAVEAREDGAAEEAARAVYFAALLRPALLAPATSARTYLSALSMRGALAGHAALQKAIGNLGFDVQTSADELTNLAGQDRRRRLPAARSALERWLSQARTARCVHTPAHVLLHELLAPKGELGEVFEAALAGAPGAETAAAALAVRLDNRGGQEEVVERAEQRTGRPRRDRIRDWALEWACRKIQEGSLALADWVEASRADKEGLDDRRRLALQRHVGALRKALVEIGTDPVGSEPERDAPVRLVAAALAAVRRACDDVTQLLDGTAPPAPRLAEVLDEPLLRLPAGCQRALGENAVARAARRRRQLAALARPEMIAPDDTAALAARRAEAAILPARRLIERLKASKQISPDGVRAENQALAEAAAVAARRSRKSAIITQAIGLPCA
jgi:hypothetical protein